MPKSDNLIEKVRGAIFSVPNFIKVRKKRYAHNTTHSFRSHADDTAKRLRKKGFSTIIKTMRSLTSTGKTITAYAVYLRKKK